jgi:hypothetical protein
VHADFNLIKDEKFKLALLKSANGYIRIDKQIQSSAVKGLSQSVFMQTYASAVKSGERFVDEVSVLQYDLVAN